MAIDPKLFAGIVGSTDTEAVFRLALTFGLEEDPIRALERTVGLIETTAADRGVAPMVQGTFGVSDGSSLWAVRYATEGRARSLFAEKKMWFTTATSNDRLIASEPFSDLPGVWHEIDESSAVSYAVAACSNTSRPVLRLRGPPSRRDSCLNLSKPGEVVATLARDDQRKATGSALREPYSVLIGMPGLPSGSA